MNTPHFSDLVGIDDNFKKVHVELGCGNNRRDMNGYVNIGVDLIDGPVVDYVCNLGFEPIPLEDSCADFVQAIDVIEHIPKCVWLSQLDVNTEGQNVTKIERHLPFIQFMNECYRIMKNGAEIYLETPFSEWGFRRDPTHVSQFSGDWWHYFQSLDNLYYNQGIVTSNFQMLECHLRPYRHMDDILCTRLKAIK